MVLRQHPGGTQRGPAPGSFHMAGGSEPTSLRGPWACVWGAAQVSREGGAQEQERQLGPHAHSAPYSQPSLPSLLRLPHTLIPDPDASCLGNGSALFLSFANLCSLCQPHFRSKTTYL